MRHNRLWDCIVVGAGGAHGSAAVYHLASRGASVLGLEAQPSAPHSQGSSHGLSRIIRLAYFEHPSYVPLLRESYRMWRELEAQSGETMLTMTGCINSSPPEADCWPGLSCFQGALQSAKEHGLEHEVLDSSQVARRFPGYRLPPSFQTLYEPEGGLLVPEKCIEVHLRLAQQQGAQLLCGTQVLGWQVLPPGAEAFEGSTNDSGGDTSGSGSSSGEEGLVRVHTSRGSFTTRRLVLAGGGWMPQLVPELKALLKVERQVVGWFEIDPAHRQDFAPDRFPVFLLQDEHGYIYGFPGDQHGFKFGKYHHLRQVSTADDVQRSVTPEDEETLRGYLRRYFPHANGRLNRTATCTFTLTPDLNFIIDQHPRHPQVVLCSACSGHGFKFASVIGSILADLSSPTSSPPGSTPHDISLFRFSRQRTGQAAVLDAFAGAAGGGSGAAARL